MKLNCTFRGDLQHCVAAPFRKNNIMDALDFADGTFKLVDRYIRISRQHDVFFQLQMHGDMNFKFCDECLNSFV